VCTVGKIRRMDGSHRCRIRRRSAVEKLRAVFALLFAVVITTRLSV